jgi:hypothetical protein
MKTNARCESETQVTGGNEETENNMIVWPAAVARRLFSQSGVELRQSG